MREKAGVLWREKGIVFCNIYGGYIEPSNLHDDFKRLLRIAQLPDIRFHDLRHSAATILLQGVICAGRRKDGDTWPGVTSHISFAS